MTIPPIIKYHDDKFRAKGYRHHTVRELNKLQHGMSFNDLEHGQSRLSIGDTNINCQSIHGINTASISTPPPEIKDEVKYEDVWVEVAKLVASDKESTDRFGGAVAINDNTIVVGASWKDYNITQHAGAVYVFTFLNNIWTEQAKLLQPFGEMNDFNRFGFSVAIENDTIVIGAPRELGIGIKDYVYVFIRSNDIWIEQKMFSSINIRDHFGHNVAISGDTLVIGAPLDDDKGAAYVFTRSGSIWTEQVKLTASDAVIGDLFGRSTTIYGNTVVIGASDKHFGNKIYAGAAYVFTRIGSVWTEQVKLIASNVKNYGYFGVSVAIEDNIITIGGVVSDPNESRRPGTVYIFRYFNKTWTEILKFKSLDQKIHMFGATVDINKGNVVIGTFDFIDIDGVNELHVYSDFFSKYSRSKSPVKEGIINSPSKNRFTVLAIDNNIAVGGNLYYDMWTGIVSVYQKATVRTE